MLQPLAIIAGMVEKVARHGVQNIVSSVFRKKIAVLFFCFLKCRIIWVRHFFYPQGLINKWRIQ